MRVRAVILGALATAAVSAQKPRAIAGRVVDRAGEPAAATVVLRWRAHPELPSLVGYTLGQDGLMEERHAAGDDGRFRIDPPHRGPFLLVAKCRGSSSTQVFPVMAGDYRELRLEPDFMMGGTVVDADGAPVAGALVRLVPTDDLQRIRLGIYKQPERRAETRTGPNGRFALHFEHGYLRDPRWNVLMAMQAEHGDRTTAPLVHVRPTAGAKTMRLALASKVEFSLLVMDQSTRKPIGGATVVDPLASSHPWTTGADGRCAVRARGGSAFVYAAGYEPAVVTRASKGMTATSIGLTRGRGLRVTLSGPHGPLAGARVLLAQHRGDAFPFEWHATVGEDGALAVRSLPDNKQPVMAFVEVEGRFVQFFEGMVRGDIDLEPIRVDPDRTVRGRVRTAEKLPVAGARVELECLAGGGNRSRRVTYTDRAGRFRFAGVLAADHRVIAARGPHGQAAVPVPENDLDEAVTVTLDPQATISGQVLRPDGAPAAGAWVAAYTSTARDAQIRGPRVTGTSLGTLADAEGRFELGVDKGTSWTLVAALLHDGAHDHVSTTAKAGQAGLVLKTALANR